MIDGIKLDFSSGDLLAHIQGRANFHKDKSDWYEKQIQGLKAGGLARQDISNDPVSSLEHSKADHAQKYALFSVIAEHIVPNEVYRLSESDLARLEFISRYY